MLIALLAFHLSMPIVDTSEALVDLGKLARKVSVLQTRLVVLKVAAVLFGTITLLIRATA